MMDWIKITDQRPEGGQRVIYYFKETGISLGCFYRREGYDCFESIDGWLCDDVTHWMPLPELPEV